MLARSFVDEADSDLVRRRPLAARTDAHALVEQSGALLRRLAEIVRS